MDAFNRGLAEVDCPLDFLVKLGPDYFEKLLGKFEEQPNLGIATGYCATTSGSTVKSDQTPEHHVRDSTKLCRGQCYKQIGGLIFANRTILVCVTIYTEKHRMIYLNKERIIFNQQYGDYHMHSDYVDGRNTISEMCARAVQNGLKTIAITEHVRRKLTYSFDDYVEEIKRAREKSEIEILIGCETKIMDVEGNIDITDNIVRKCDIVLISFHGFPEVTMSEYISTIEKAFGKNEFARIWAHPFLLARKQSLILEETNYHEIISILKNHNVVYERNMKYDLPPQRFNEMADRYNLDYIIGSDSHDISMLRTLK